MIPSDGWTPGNRRYSWIKNNLIIETEVQSYALFLFVPKFSNK
jgi:hypothetical protein